MRLVVLVALLSACGRMGFDRVVPDAGGTDGGPRDAYSPPTCTGCSGNQFCGTAPGACGGPAMCFDVPATCDGTVDPVCGCDGTTYDSTCLAAQAGVGVAASGACTSASACSPPCAATEYCYTPPGMCEATGTCEPRPTTCEGLSMAVCGCDLNEYIGGCQAAMAGTSILSVGGACPR